MCSDRLLLVGENGHAFASVKNSASTHQSASLLKTARTVLTVSEFAIGIPILRLSHGRQSSFEMHAGPSCWRPRGVSMELHCIVLEKYWKRIGGYKNYDDHHTRLCLRKPKNKNASKLGMMWVERQAIRTSECNVLFSIRPTEHDIMS